MVALIKQYGTWKKVCEHVADTVKKTNPKFDNEGFIKWMLLQEKYSPNDYEGGLFGDNALYVHAYSIYKKLREGSNQHHMILVCGKIGKGKSTLGLQIASMIDPTLDMSRICYVPHHLFKRMSVCKEFQANIIDEGGNFFKSRNAMTALNRDLTQAFQLVRDLRQVIIVCYDEPEKLDKEIIDKFDSCFFKIYSSDESGDKRFRSYYAFNSTDFMKVKEHLKKKVPMGHAKIIHCATWMGHNNAHIPVLNGISDDLYRSEKRRYLKDHMAALSEKWKEGEVKPKEEPVNIGQPIQPLVIDPVPADVIRSDVRDYTLRVPEYAKVVGINEDTIYELLKKKRIDGMKIGGSWRIKSHIDIPKAQKIGGLAREMSPLAANVS